MPKPCQGLRSLSAEFFEHENERIPGHPQNSEEPLFLINDATIDFYHYCSYFIFVLTFSARNAQAGPDCNKSRITIERELFSYKKRWESERRWE